MSVFLILLVAVIEIEPVEVTMYSLSSGCQPCLEAKIKLEKHGVKVNVINDVYNEVPVFKIKDKTVKNLDEVYKILKLKEELKEIPKVTQEKVTYYLIRRGRRYYWVKGGDSSRPVSRCVSH